MQRRFFITGAVTALVNAAWGQDGNSHAAADLADTVRLQSALNGGGRVTLESGRHYRLSPPPGARSALFIKSDTTLDLAGATLELAPGRATSLIATPGDVPARNIRIVGGRIVGNGTGQPAAFDAGTGITPTFFFPKCDGLELRDLQMHDTYMYALYTRGNDGRLDNLDVDGAIGGGLHVGGSRWRIGRINVRNVTYFDDVNCQGNPFIVNLRDSAVGSVRCQNYGFGVKFQDGCENVTVESIEALGGANNDRNGDFLVKIQGTNDRRGRRFNRAISIGRIVARNGPSSGLYIVYSDGVNIATYQGENNGRLAQRDGKNAADVLVIDSDNVHFDALRVKGVNRYGLWLHDKVGRFTVDTLELEAAKDTRAIPMVLGSASVKFGSSSIRGFAK